MRAYALERQADGANWALVDLIPHLDEDEVGEEGTEHNEHQNVEAGSESLVLGVQHHDGTVVEVEEA
jgi:hypothetical protein